VQFDGPAEDSATLANKLKSFSAAAKAMETIGGQRLRHGSYYLLTLRPNGNVGAYAPRALRELVPPEALQKVIDAFSEAISQPIGPYYWDTKEAAVSSIADVASKYAATKPTKRRRIARIEEEEQLPSTSNAGSDSPERHSGAARAHGGSSSAGGVELGSTGGGMSADGAADVAPAAPATAAHVTWSSPLSRFGMPDAEASGRPSQPEQPRGILRRQQLSRTANTPVIPRQDHLENEVIRMESAAASSAAALRQAEGRIEALTAATGVIDEKMRCEHGPVFTCQSRGADLSE